ncbi:MAG: hypothetical protein AAF560_14855 [Acidobacteriota bacterium]
MPPRIAAALGLTFALLLATTSGLAGHDHGARAEFGSRSCSVDHVAPHEDSPSAGLHAAGERHQHQCVGCCLSGHRSLLSSAQWVSALAPFRQSECEHATTPRALRCMAGGTLRGPPIA